MKLTKEKLKQLILEMMDDEQEMTPEEKEEMIKSLGTLIETGKWDSINQAIFLADSSKPPLPVPWNLLPMKTMEDDDLVELGRHLMKLKGWEKDGTGGQLGRMLRHGIKGMAGGKGPFFPNTKKFVVGAIKKILGIPLRDRN